LSNHHSVPDKVAQKISANLEATITVAVAKVKVTLTTETKLSIVYKFSVNNSTVLVGQKT